MEIYGVVCRPDCVEVYGIAWKCMELNGGVWSGMCGVECDRKPQVCRELLTLRKSRTIGSFCGTTD